MRPYTRELFAVACIHHGDRDVYVLDDSGEYADKQMQGAFNVWQARAALPTDAAMEVKE